MSALSNEIEDFIKLLMEYGEVELQRNELAQHFGCVPSQINYVLATRFSIERGYIITSRRGGGGYIRVRRVETTPDDRLYWLVTEGIGQTISGREAAAIASSLLDAKIISRREYALISAATGKILGPMGSERARAVMLKSLLTALLEERTGAAQSSRRDGAKNLNSRSDI